MARPAVPASNFFTAAFTGLAADAAAAAGCDTELGAAGSAEGCGPRAAGAALTGGGPRFAGGAFAGGEPTSVGGAFTCGDAAGGGSGIVAATALLIDVRSLCAADKPSMYKLVRGCIDSNHAPTRQGGLGLQHE